MIKVLIYIYIYILCFFFLRQLDIDYNALTDGKGNGLLVGWPSFSEKFMEYVTANEPREKSCLEIIDKLHRTDISVCKFGF